MTLRLLWCGGQECTGIFVAMTTAFAADSEVATLVLQLRPSRRKAREAAVAEALALLRGLDAREAAGGPLSEVAGVRWVNVTTDHLSTALERLKGIGYVGSVQLVESIEDDSDEAVASLRWKRRPIVLVPVYEEVDTALRPLAPDARPFLLECGDGVVRRVSGYRGGRGALEHRALPVVDARLLVNLVFAEERGTLLDPFCGAGGVVLAAGAAGWSTVSADLDPTLRFGLTDFGSRHIVADARALPLASGSIDAVASEPPYDPSAHSAVVDSVGEIARVLRKGARAALLLSTDQLTDVRDAAERAGLGIELATPINRKGTSVMCLCLVR